MNLKSVLDHYTISRWFALYELTFKGECVQGFLFSAPQNKMEMINMAKAIASNAMVILKFAHVIAEQSVDER